MMSGNLHRRMSALEAAAGWADRPLIVAASDPQLTALIANTQTETPGRPIFVVYTGVPRNPDDPLPGSIDRTFS